MEELIERLNRAVDRLTELEAEYASKKDFSQAARIRAKRSGVELALDFARTETL